MAFAVRYLRALPGRRSWALYWLLSSAGDEQAKARRPGGSKGSTGPARERPAWRGRSEGELAFGARSAAEAEREVHRPPSSADPRSRASKMTVGVFLLLSVASAPLSAGPLACVVAELFVAALVLAMLGVRPLYVVVALQAKQAGAQIRGAVSRSHRPDGPGAAGRPCVHDRLGMVAERSRRRSARSSALYDEQNFGMTLPDAMRAMARRVPVLDARFFVTAVLTQRETGGNLAEVLDNLVVGDARAVQGQAAGARDVGARPDHRLDAVAPAAELAGRAVHGFQPQFMRVLCRRPARPASGDGRRSRLQLIGTYIISRLVKIEY